MFSCSCGRQFNSETSLGQHRVDKGHTRGTKFTRPGAATRRPPREGWLWNDVKGPTKAIDTIDFTGLEASATSVSSKARCELLCSYNWLSKNGEGIHIGGPVPVWHDRPLPVTLPKDEPGYADDVNAARPPKYSFEPLFRATAEMNPGLRFDDVDIVVNRNSLRKLFKFCSGNTQDSFRVNLILVHNTLFIERCERSARFLAAGSRNSGWGRNFERAFTRCPQYSRGTGDSAGHHRALCYPLGNINCVVRFEVDACYAPTRGEQAQLQTDQELSGTDRNALSVGMGRLSVGDNKVKERQAMGTMQQDVLAHTSTAAEIKTGSKSKGIGRYLPQLWFGRTPWLIIGQHKEGTFNKVQVMKAADQFEEWESKRQIELQRLVAVLSQLRDAVKGEGKSCVAIYEKTSNPQAIRVFASVADKQALPADLIRRFWVSENTGTTTISSH